MIDTAARPSLQLLETEPENARAALFEEFFLGGFECSCQRLEDGRRLDLLASTRHDEFADADFQRLRRAGMTACRDGLSWVKVERRPGRFDFSSLLPKLEAAQRREVRVIWDLMHFGWPDDLDVFSGEFPRRLGLYAAAFARAHAEACAAPPMVTPINEMSYLAWAGGDVRCLFPFCAARGVELKAQLVRATIEAIEAIREVSPGARFLQPEPLMTLVPEPEHPLTWRRVESDNLLQYQAWDMLSGRVWPSLGGHPRYLDVIGVNFYPDNQFTLDGTTIARGDRVVEHWIQSDAVELGARTVAGRADLASAAAAGSARRHAERGRGPRTRQRLMGAGYLCTRPTSKLNAS